MSLNTEYDACVIGGGFYGCSLALAVAPALPRIVVLEREPDVLMRASYANQARVHNGYHYPRSLLTALRSAANYSRFTQDFRECVDGRALHVYAIARGNSHISAYQFRKFCEQVRIPLRPAPSRISKLFTAALIEAVFAVEESTFDAGRLRALMRSRLDQAGIEIACGREVERIEARAGSALRVHVRDGPTISAAYVFNCSYSQVNQLLGRSSLRTLPLKHELAELALIEPPPELAQTAVTVMDGLYFSVVPFPSLGLHTLTHVMYTPHFAWSDEAGADSTGSAIATGSLPASKSVFMLKDAQRYLPVLREARYVDSLFETKTVLRRSEIDDSRPIVCHRHADAEGLFAILGAKIDNIYDIVQALAAEPFSRSAVNVHRC